MTAPSKPDRIHPVLIGVLAVMILVPAAIPWMFLFGKSYGAIAFGLMLFPFAAAYRYWHRLKRTRPERTLRIEKTLSGGEPSNDPRQMARWMR